MKNFYLFFFLLLLQNQGFAQATKLQWARTIDTSNSHLLNIARNEKVVLDRSGNVYSLGNFIGAFDFDPGPGVVILDSSAGNQYVQKLDSTGRFVWVKCFGKRDNSSYLDIATDNFNNILLTGSFRKTIDFDPGPGVYNMTNPENFYDATIAFVSKLDSNGNFIWAKKFDSLKDSVLGCGGLAITTDALGNVYTSGHFQSGIFDFDPGAAVFSFACYPRTSFSGFVSKLDANGNFVWAKQLGCEIRGATPSSIIIDKKGNVFTAGNFSGLVDFNSDTGTLYLKAAQQDGFITKMDSAGHFKWAKQIPGTKTINLKSLALDANQNIYCSGTFDGTADFDPGIWNYYVKSVYGGDYFLLKLDTTGTFIWAKTMPTKFIGFQSAMDVDVHNNVYLSGGFKDSIDVQTDTLSSLWLKSKGSLDMMLVKWNTDGKYLWSKQLGAKDNGIGAGIKVDAHKNIYIVGSFFDTADFDLEAGVYNIGINNVILPFVMKLSQPDALLSIPEITDEAAVLIYPNPSTGIVSVLLPQFEAALTISVFNTLGNKIFSLETREQKVTIDLSQQPNGLYLLQLTDKKEQRRTAKIVKY